MRSISASRSCWVAGATTSMMNVESLSPTRSRRMLSASVALSAAIATCLPESAWRPVKYIATSMPRMHNGSSTVENLNARPRICSRYSRLAIRRTLCIGLASNGLDEDLLERGLDQFESINLGCGSCLMQQLLRVALRLELDLGVGRKNLRFRNLIAVQERRTAFKFDDHAIALITGLDLAQIPCQHGLAVMDEADAVAQLLHLIHAMG